jgi:hypothetical protein
MTEYFYPAYPRLYRIGGDYAPGLARLFGAHECHEGKAHVVKDGPGGQCTQCGVHVLNKEWA